MTWFSLACRWWADADVDATGSPWAWPYLLEALKEGNGWAKPSALRDARMLRCAGLDKVLPDGGASILDAYAAAGLLVRRDDDGLWTARSWERWQRNDDAKRERDRKYAASRRESSRVVATFGDVAASRRESAGTETRTETTTTTDSTSVGVATSPARPREDVKPAGLAPAPVPFRPDLPGEVKTLSDLEQLAIAVRAPGRRGMMLDSGSAHQLAELMAKHGLDKCAAVLRADCCGAERPVAMLRARLDGGQARGGRDRGSGRPRSFGPVELAPEWEGVATVAAEMAAEEAARKATGS